MARLSALTFIDFKPAAANEKPTSTQIGNMITHFYKECYKVVYGFGSYSTDESTDTSTIINTDEFRSMLDAELSPLAQAWHDASEEFAMPRMKLSKDFIAELKHYSAQKRGFIDTIRLWNEDELDEYALY